MLCSVERDTRAGAKGSGARCKGIIHWLRRDDAVPCIVRLYGNLFKQEEASGDDSGGSTRCSRRISGSAGQRDVVDRAYDEPRSVTQLERNGYFCVDAAGSPLFLPSACPALPLC